MKSFHFRYSLVLLLCTCCISFSRPIQAQETNTSNSVSPLRADLHECLRIGLQNNFGIRSLELSQSSAQETLDQSRRNLLPGVAASANQNLGYSHADNGGNFHSGTYQLSASMDLYKGGQNWNTIRQNQIRVDQSKQQVIQAQNELTINIIDAFLSTIRSQELLKYQQNVVLTSEAQWKQGELRWKNGNMLESDYLLLKAQYESDKYNVVNAEISRQNSLLNLKELLALPSGAALELLAPETQMDEKQMALPTLEELTTQTLSWFPDIKIAQTDLQIADYETKIAKGAFLPSVSLGGSLGTGYQSGYGGWGTQVSKGVNEQISLSLSIPIWSKGQNASALRQTKIKQEQLKISAQQTELNLRKALEQAYLQVSGNAKQYEASQTKLNACKASYDAYGNMFNAGSITAVDLLQQKSTYLNALNEFIQAKYTYLLNRKVINVYMGYNIQ